MLLLSASFLVIGAGVVGLTTALELRARYPTAKITVAAKFLPGDSAPEYASAGAEPTGSQRPETMAPKRIGKQSPTGSSKSFPQLDQNVASSP